MMSLSFHACILFVCAVLATVYLVPKIISIVQFKQLMDNPNERSSHVKATPSLGGVAFYIVFVLSFYFNHKYDVQGVAMCILPGLTVLLFLGLKDDLVVLAPRTKLMGQIVACTFVLFHDKFSIIHFHGFFGINVIPEWVGMIVALVMMLAIINAFNLIDGIDGLAASIGIVSFASMSALFFLLNRHFLALSALSMVAILVGFLVFNLSRKDSRRIFMGDTGSMLIGFLVAVMCVRLMAIDENLLIHLPFNRINIPIVIVSIVLIPLYDTMRVFTIRILNGRSPFTADRNHLHHILLDAFSMSHRRTSFIIAVLSCVNLIAIYFLVRYSNLWVTTALFGAGTIGATLFLNRIKSRKRRQLNKIRYKIRHQRNLNSASNPVLYSESKTSEKTGIKR